MYVCKSLVCESGVGKLPKSFYSSFVVFIIQIFYSRLSCQLFLFQLHLIAYACTFSKMKMGGGGGCASSASEVKKVTRNKF